jgi:hypothetical protein
MQLTNLLLTEREKRDTGFYKRQNYPTVINEKPSFPVFYLRSASVTGPRNKKQSG